MTYIRSDPNDLTKRLLDDGYTPDHMPDYAQWCSGEACYKQSYIRTLTYETPCGLLVRGADSGSSGYACIGGVEFRHENGNPSIPCPYIPSRQDCKLRHEALQNSYVRGFPAQCNLRQTDKPWSDDLDIVNVRKRQQTLDERRQKDGMRALAKEVRKSGVGFCPNHSRWDREKQEAFYLYDYSPYQCSYCQFTQRPCLRCGMDDQGKKGNVLVDVRERFVIPAVGLLPESFSESITKGIWLFSKPMRLAVCHMSMQNTEWVRGKIEGRREYYVNLYFSEHHGTGYTLGIENVRVIESGKKDARDLMTDLAAIRDGQTVIHDSDRQAAAKAKKAEGKAKRKNDKVRKYERIVASGEWNQLEDYQYDKIVKTLGMERIDEILAHAETAKPEQMTMFGGLYDGQA